MSINEERRMLELDEAVEAMDSAMEYKNELLCGTNKELEVVRIY